MEDKVIGDEVIEKQELGIYWGNVVLQISAHFSFNNY